MTDIDDTADNLDTAPEGEPEDLVTKLRKQANSVPKLYGKIDTLTAENNALRQKVALADAGLTLSDKQKIALIASHGEAEMSRDALRATAVELGFIQADEPDEDAARRETALAGAASIASAHLGAAPPAPVAPLRERIAQAETSGDWKTASALKAQMIALAVRQGQTVQLS